MIKHNIIQNTPEWHQFRQSHFGASESAAMLGLSKDLTRNELLEFKSTGKSKEYSDWVQANILDYGHEVEALARGILEAELDDDLFQVTCSQDSLSSSCDGLTLDRSVAFEHKQWSEDLVNFIIDNKSLPDSHMPQCQQILLITGAKRVIFVCSDGTENKRVMIDVYPDKVWFDRITSGWLQFKKDLAEYQPREITEKPVVVVTHHLPSVNIQVKGELTVCNLADVTPHFDKFIEQAKVYLETDEDFAIAESESKIARDQAKRCNDTARSVIDQMLSVSEIVSKLEEYAGKFNALALKQEKLVKTQKEKIKDQIIEDGFVLCERHVDAIHDELAKFVSFGALARTLANRGNLEQACKNKRTLASLHNAVDTEVASIKIKLDELARVVRKNITYLPEDLSLFRDLQSIITKPEDDFKLVIETRLAEQKRKDEEAKQRAIAEATERMQKVKEAESARIASLPTDIKSVLADEEKQAEIVKAEAVENNVVEFAHPMAARYDKAINEAIDSLCDCCGKYGVTKEIATEVIDAILRSEVKNVKFS